MIKIIITFLLRGWFNLFDDFSLCNDDNIKVKGIYFLLLAFIFLYFAWGKCWLIYIPFFTGTGLAFSLMTLDSEMAMMRIIFNTGKWFTVALLIANAVNQTFFLRGWFSFLLGDFIHYIVMMKTSRKHNILAYLKKFTCLDQHLKL